MMPPFVVRPVLPADYDRWHGLWLDYNAFYGRAGSTALASDITSMRWSRFFDPYEPMFALVAEYDGRQLGLVHYLLHRSTTAIAPSVYLQDLFTSEEARSQGVGRALIEAVFAYARDVGIPAFLGRPTKPTRQLWASTTKLSKSLALSCTDTKSERNSLR